MYKIEKWKGCGKEKRELKEMKRCDKGDDMG
jgi:hypothetical protein